MTTTINRPETAAAGVSNSNALFEEAHRIRRRRRSVFGLFLMASLAAGLGIAFGAAGGSSGQSATRISAFLRSYGALEHPSRATTNAMLDFLMPTSGASFANGFRFGNAEQVLRGDQLKSCLDSKGFKGQASWGEQLYDGDNEVFPYLAYLDAVGFGPTTIGPNPTDGPSALLRTSYGTTLKACQKELHTVAWRPIDQLEASVRSQWWTIVNQISGSRAFQTALVGFRTCTADAGIRVDTIDGYFTYMSQHGAIGTGPGGNALERGFATTYARCLGPAEVIRDHLRVQARSKFISTHAAEINVVEAVVNESLVKSLNAKLGSSI